MTEASPVSILIVDDEIELARQLGEFLKSRHYQVFVATNGRSAIETFRVERPCVVLLDMRMPDIGGLDVLEAIRGLDASVRVIIMTGNLETDKQALACAGAYCVLAKPFDLRQLLEAINRP